MRNSLTLLFAAAALLLSAQNPGKTWHFEPFNKKSMAGIGLYEGILLAGDKKANEIIVAVIDAGVDINHPDLQGQLWINEDEIADNGIDDDNNGYIDDIYGWNFIGSKDTSIGYDNMEITRQYVILNEKYELSLEEQVENKEEYQLYQEIRAKFRNERDEAKSNFEFYSQLKSGLEALERSYGEDITKSELKEHKSRNRSEEMARLVLLMQALMEKGEFSYPKAKKDLIDAYDHFHYNYYYGYNAKFEPRYLVGDNYNDASEKYYGNNVVYYGEKFSDHGTHVAGIIAANRENDFGAQGICQSAKIMSIRVVPQGDERDKDVANGIYYAVDNGAKIINMSFGKDYVHNSEAVRKAIAYAKDHQVLLVHAAGNDALNTDINTFYPNDFNDTYKSIWIEVGASSWQKKPRMLAEFSNYGSEQVDVFAPGVEIYSTTPENNYDAYDGTSMASPVVAGVAAFVWSYYPELTAEELRSILIDSAIPLKGRQKLPGSKKKTKLKKISVSGSIINLPAAMRLAEQRSSSN